MYDLTVGDSCHLYLGSTGKTKRSGFVSTTGIFDFDSLTVAAGGEVTATNNLVGANNRIQLSVSDIFIFILSLVILLVKKIGSILNEC